MEPTSRGALSRQVRRDRRRIGGELGSDVGSSILHARSVPGSRRRGRLSSVARPPIAVVLYVTLLDPTARVTAQDWWNWHL